MKVFSFLCCFLLILGCRPSVNTGDVAQIRAEVAALDTDKKKAQFLANLRADDQAERHPEAKLPLDKRLQNDLRRLEQVGAYMQMYGYPSRSLLGDTAAEAPLLIVHHSPYDEARYKYFDYIYKGYLAGDIDADGLAFFLGRFQHGVNGEWITFDGPFTVEQELDTLIKALHLSDHVASLSLEKRTKS